MCLSTGSRRDCRSDEVSCLFYLMRRDLMGDFEKTCKAELMRDEMVIFSNYMLQQRWKNSNLYVNSLTV